MSNFPQLSPSGARFFIRKIANSRKEIQIGVIDNTLQSYESGNFKLYNPQDWEQGVSQNAYLSQIYQQLQIVLKQNLLGGSALNQEVVVSVGKGKYIPVINILFLLNSEAPTGDANRYHMVLKLNEPLPPEIKRLATINLLTMKSEYLSQDIFYAGKRPPADITFGEALETDYSMIAPYRGVRNNSDFESHDQLTGSIGNQRLNELVSGSYQERLVDYSDFKNFIHFSSAKVRLQNFKYKLEKIESHQTKVSQSLYTSGIATSDSSGFNPAENLTSKQIRLNAFAEITSIKNGFTDYEKFLYYDNQVETSASAPGLGTNYIDDTPFVDNDKIKTDFNYEGLPTAYIISGSPTEIVNLTAGKYNLEDVPFNNSSGSFYLSFLMKASSSVSTKIIHTNTQTSSAPLYPWGSMHTSQPLFPDATGSEYRRYIIAASGSFWIPGITGKIPGHPIKGNIDWSSGSADVDIIESRGSITGSVIRAYGDYVYYSSYITGSGKPVSGSFVPRGDLFDVQLKAYNSAAELSSVSAIVTDIKITEKSPDAIKPFSNLYLTTTDIFSDWFDGMINSASFYDSQNIHRLYNNIPEVYQADEETSNHDMIRYIDMMGEFYDEYKVLIDDYFRVFNLGFSDYDTVPPRFDELLSSALGFNILSEQSGSILSKFGLYDNTAKDLTEYNHKLYNNILNNLSYLYKTKGTQNSIKALLNCYGLPSNVLRLRESGQNLKKYDADFLSNDTDVTAVGGLHNLTGSITFEGKAIEFFSLIVQPEMSSSFRTSWNHDSTLSQSGVEAIFKMDTTETTMSLFSAKTGDATSEQWRLIVIPSGSTHPTKGKLKFQLSNANHVTSSITGSSVSLETDYLDILDNNYTNVLLQKSSSGHDFTAEYVYELMVARLEGDEIGWFTQKTLTSDGSASHLSGSNRNFLSGSGEQNLYICPDYTGSIAEIRTWKKALSVSAFKQHVYNYHSTTADHFSGSMADLGTHYKGGENYHSGSQDFILWDTAVNPDFDGSITFDQGFYNSASVLYDSDIVTMYNFPIYGSGGGSIQYNDNSILIPDDFSLISDLSWEQSVLKSNIDLLDRDVINTNVLEFGRSPQDVINDFLKDNIGNLDFNDLFADPRDEFKDNYPDLDAFNKTLFTDFDISININRFIRATGKIFNSSLVESIKKLLPARARVNIGTTLKPTYTHRIKFPAMRDNPSIEDVGKTTGLLEDTTTLEQGSEFLPPEETLENIDATFEATSYPMEENVGIDFFDLRNIPERDFNLRPELTWGTSSSDTHFTTLQAGISDDGNTGYLETEDVSYMIGDIEYLSGSVRRDGDAFFDYEKEKTFRNKKILKTSETVPERYLGTTLQFVHQTSSISPYGKILDETYRIPQNHITAFGGHSHYLMGRGFEGYQHRGDEDSKSYTDETGFSSGLSFASPLVNTLGHIEVEGLGYEDLTTRAFYRVEIEKAGNTKLKIVKTGDNQGTLGH